MTGDTAKRIQVRAFYKEAGGPLVASYDGISDIAARDSVPEDAEYAIVSCEWTAGFDVKEATEGDPA